MTSRTALFTSQKVINTATDYTVAIIRRSIHNCNPTTAGRSVSLAQLQSQSQSQPHHLFRHGFPTFSIPTALVVAATDDRSLYYLLAYPSRHTQRTKQKRSRNTTQCADANDTPSSNTMEMVVLHNDDRKMIRRIMRRIQSWASTVWDAVLVLMRTTEVVIRLSPLLILTPAAMMLTPTHSSASTSCDESHGHSPSHISTINPQTSKASDLAWRYTTYTIQKLGPVFVKLFQWAATRRDIFPEPTCDRLSELHSSTMVHSWSHTKRILEEGGFSDCKEGGGGCDIEEGKGVVLKVDREGILGSGCVAQVYRGTLGGNGDGKERDVAVKVLHPNMLERTERDLLLMKRMANLVRKYVLQVSIPCLSIPLAVVHLIG